jgi:hypothetical protein
MGDVAAKSCFFQLPVNTRINSHLMDVGQRVELPLSGWAVAVFHHIDTTPADWDNLAPADNIFLQRAYLSVIQQCPPPNMQFAYLIFYFHNQPKGIAYLQHLHLNIGQSLQGTLLNQPSLINRIKSAITKLGNFNLLVCGNLLLTGAHGFHFPNGNPSETTTLLEHALSATAQSFRQQGCSTDLTMIKDISPCCHEISDNLGTRGFAAFSFQPNMVLPIQPSWKSLSDYLLAMSSKYRVRARRAFKKKEGLALHELNSKVIALESSQMMALYQAVAAKADFNAFTLHHDYFEQLKLRFPRDFRVFAYYDHQEMVGFYTTMRNGTTLEAHFLGFNEAINTHTQLYLNMLYDMVNLAITDHAQTLIFARTAMEIKSSVGAIPEQLDCRLKHRRPIQQSLTPFFVKLFEPQINWIQRHPFRGID